MREIKIVLNNDEETFHNNPFDIYIDNTKLENFNKFSLVANKPVPNKEGYVNLDDIIKYTVEYFAPYFEE